MAEPKTVKLSSGGQTLYLTAAELPAYVASLPRAAQDELIHLSGPIDSIYQNSRGEMVQESLSLDQIVKRIRTGEQPVVTGSKDPKLDLKRKHDQATIRTQIDKDSDLAALRQSVDPWRLTGLPQALENKIVGKNVAAEHRQRLTQENPVVNIAGNMALGLGVSAGLRAGATKLGLTAAKGTTAANVGRFVAEDVGIASSFYITDQLNNNKPLVAEDLARNIVGGLIVTAPLLGGLVVRRPLVNAIKNRGKGSSSLLSKGADIGVVVGVAAKQPKWMQAAAATRVGQRVIDRMTKSGAIKGAKGVANEVTDLTKQSLKDQTTIGKMVPGLKSTAANDILDTVVGYLDDAKQAKRLQRVDWGSVNKGVQGIRTKVEAARKIADKTPKSVGRLNVQKHPKFSPEGLREWSTQTTNIVNKLDDTGFGVVSSYLRPLVSSKKPFNTYNSWVKARIETVLGEGAGMGGAAEAGVLLRNFIEDPVMWNSKLVARGKRLNEAIDGIGDAYKQLDNLTIDLADNLDISAKGTRILDINKSVDKIRDGYKTLFEEKIISEGTLTGMESGLREVQRSLKIGAKAYEDLTVINKARQAAATNWRKFDDQVVKRDAAQMYTEAEEALRHTEARKQKYVKGFLALAGGVDYVARGTAYGLNAFYQLNEQDRADLYEEVTDAIASYTGSPFALDEALGDYLGPLQGDDPELASLSGVSASNTIFWLQNQAPRRDRSVYGAGTSKAKRDEFLEKFVASIDPMSVPEVSLKGMASNGAVAALRVANPELYAEIGVIASEILESVDLATLPRTLQNGLNQLLGGIDPLYTGPALLELQTNYAQTQAQQQTYGGAGGMNSSSNPQEPGNQFTFSQRLASY